MNSEFNFSEKTIAQYIDVLQSNAPVPGGGSVAALCGALSVSLGMMACKISMVRPKFAPHKDRYDEMLVKAQQIKQDFIRAIDKDAVDFTNLMAVYKLPKFTDEEKAYRAEKLQSELINASIGPMALIQSAGETIAFFEQAKDLCSKDIVSDVATGVALCKAVIESAAVTTLTNCSQMKPSAHKDKCFDTATRIAQIYLAQADTLYLKILSDLVESSSN